jgi:hypothetical protein
MITIRPTRPNARIGARLPVLAAAIGILALGVGSARAQSGSHYGIMGGLGSAAGTASSPGVSITGESGSIAARSSSAGADLIGGFMGLAFASRARVAIETGTGRYASVAFPLLYGAGVGSVLEEFGTLDTAIWRLGHWSPRDSAYIEAADGTLETIERGKGYWLITVRSATAHEEGLTAPVGDCEIALESGPGDRPAFQQLGNPFLFPISPGELRVTDGTITMPLMAPENRLTETAVRTWEPDSQSFVAHPAVVRAGEAFWVKKLAPGPVRVIVPYRAAGTGAPVSPVLAKPPGARWAVALSARQGGRTCEPVVMGSAPVAADRWNPLCESRAPAPPGGALALSVREENWGSLSGDYARAFHPDASALSWEISVHGAAWPGELVLKLDGCELPAGTRMSLQDLGDGSMREIQAGAAFTIAAKKDQRLRLTVTLDPSTPPNVVLADGLRYVYPNPFGRSAGLVFALAAGGDLRAEIYDVSGRRVKTLSMANHTAGERVLVWDGRDEAGSLSPPGVYLARYQAGRAGGVARLVKVE